MRRLMTRRELRSEDEERSFDLDDPESIHVEPRSFVQPKTHFYLTGAMLLDER